jgi:hypothetical protein
VKYFKNTRQIAKGLVVGLSVLMATAPSVPTASAKASGKPTLVQFRHSCIEYHGKVRWSDNELQCVMRKNIVITCAADVFGQCKHNVPSPTGIPPQVSSNPTPPDIPLQASTDNPPPAANPPTGTDSVASNAADPSPDSVNSDTPIDRTPEIPTSGGSNGGGGDIGHAPGR